jgi:hypothetical protein
VITDEWLVIYIDNSGGEYRTKKQRRQAKKTLPQKPIIIRKKIETHD